MTHFKGLKIPKTKCNLFCGTPCSISALLAATTQVAPHMQCVGVYRNIASLLCWPSTQIGTSP